MLKKYGFTIPLLLVLFSSLSILPVHAITRTVTDCTSSLGAAGRLSDIIASATSGDTIVFNCGTATIPFVTAITINKDLTIDGANTITFDGGHSTNFLFVDGVSVTVKNLIFQNGSNSLGGAIFTNSALTVINSTFSDNYGGLAGGSIASMASATITISDSTFTGNGALLDGGAINSLGTITITNSTFSNNFLTSDGFGEAIYLYNPTAISESTFIHNTCYGTIQDMGGNISDTDSIGCPISSGNAVEIIPSVSVLGCALDTADGVEVAGVPDDTYCRILMKNGGVVSYSGAIPADLIGLGVILAVDVYRLEGGMTVNSFPNYARICLAGKGRFFYMDGRDMPRYPIEMPIEWVDNLTCAWIPAPGTVVLTN
jgi:predicted outer membrane repeat protein